GGLWRNYCREAQENGAAAVTLTDAGALVALVDKNQPQNTRCRATFTVLSLPLITTWPAFTEAMYLVYQIGGWPLQRTVWSYAEEGTRQIHSSTAAEQARMRQLMEQYRDTPMDLAHASLVATAPPGSEVNPDVMAGEDVGGAENRFR